MCQRFIRIHMYKVGIILYVWVQYELKIMYDTSSWCRVQQCAAKCAHCVFNTVYSLAEPKRPHINRLYGFGFYIIYVLRVSKVPQQAATFFHFVLHGVSMKLPVIACYLRCTLAECRHTIVVSSGKSSMMRITYNCLPTCREYLQLLCLLLSCSAVWPMLEHR